VFQHRSPAYTLFSIVLDLALTLGALLLGQALRVALPYGEPLLSPLETPWPVVLLTLTVWSGTFFLFAVYDPQRTYRLGRELQSVLAASLFALLVLAGTLYFSYRITSRLFILYFYGLNVIFLVGWRLAAHFVLRILGNGQRHRTRRVLIIGTGELAQQIAATIRDYAWMGLQLVGFLDDSPAALDMLGTVLGRVDEARAVVEKYLIDEVIITLPYPLYDRLNQIIPALQSLPVQIRVAPNYLNLVLYRATVEDFSGLPLINLRDPALSAYQRVVKRAFDLVIATLGLLFGWPLLALIALAIKLDSPGPIIFRQKRVGENERLFTMYKFRSMVANAEDKPSTAVPVDASGRLIYKVEDDPRVTRVGRLLRRASLDELPQLVNVLKGEMSLVGPRPEMPWLVEKYAPWQHKRFAIPQGLTGWWQVNGRSDKPMYLHTEDDLYYIQNYSVLLDIIILWRTIFAVLRRRGAF
jgi:exopolysaccharide biosynthesis polyprenyl glycosylphosphotransferase